MSIKEAIVSTSLYGHERKQVNNLWACWRVSLDHLKELVVGHFDVPRHVPGEVDHGNDGFDALQFVPFVPLHCQLVLVG